MSEKAQVARYAEMIARLARPLADREAVLWLGRLDESGFARLERACLAAIADRAEAAVAFSRAFARATALLDHDEETAAPTVAAPSRREPPSTVSDLAVDTDTIPLTPAATSADAMYTLASATHAMAPRKPGDTDPR